MEACIKTTHNNKTPPPRNKTTYNLEHPLLDKTLYIYAKLFDNWATPQLRPPQNIKTTPVLRSH